MFDTVRNNKRVVQGFLALITLPFALWGVESYVNRSSSGMELAVVGDIKIGPQEFQEALRDQGERMQQQLRERFDPRMLETPEAKKSVLNGMVNQRLLMLAARDAHISVDDDALVQFIAQVPALQENGKFSPERYQALVAARGMTKDAFESRLRQDLAMQQLIQPIGDAVYSSKKSSGAWVRAQLEQRTISEFRFTPESFIKDVKLDGDAATKYYEANREKFELPEQVKVEYLVLDQAALAQQLVVSDADIEARYKANPERYTQAETRRASHILLTLPKEAGESDVASAQTKANELLSQLKQNSKVFADLAQKHSQDPGSAQKGGDLDWFGKGMMVKSFEDAVFSLKLDETSGVVRSDFGLHIIRLTGVRPERVTPLADVRQEIADEVRRELATRKFAEAVESFNNMVYEQPDSLLPAASQWKLPLQRSDWLAKGTSLPSPFNHPKLQATIFSADLIKKQQNSESVEIAPGKLLSARVVEHRPASLQALDVVRPSIIQQLTREKAGELAVSEGEARLARLNKGEAVDLKWGPVRKVLRAAPQGMPSDVVRSVFSWDPKVLPGYVGARLDGGNFSLYKISAVEIPVKDDPRTDILAQQYGRLVAEEEFTAWLGQLRKRYGVDVRESALTKSDR